MNGHFKAKPTESESTSQYKKKYRMHIRLLKRGCRFSREKSSQALDLAIRPPSRAEVNDEWSYTSIPPIRLHGVDRHITLPLCFIKKCLQCSINFINIVSLHITFIPIEHNIWIISFPSLLDPVLWASFQGDKMIRILKLTPWLNCSRNWSQSWTKIRVDSDIFLPSTINSLLFFR
jgi:hypothetical protein